MPERVLAWLGDKVPDSRLHHILRVEQTAALLPSPAAAAGLIHDLTQNFTPQQPLEIAEVEGLEVEGFEQANPHLLHPLLGAIVARDRFGVQDEEILQEIENHTLGRPGTLRIGCIVFQADSIDLGRGQTSELKAWGLVSWKNIAQAVWESGDYYLKYLMNINRLIQHRTVLQQNWAMQMASRNRPSAQDNNFITA
ncbi:MAG TPA: phosphohydrolase [Cyanobacteria bacterium UBA11372]|nr:phosphohydrolase [Cyanobacteria bacterium UBA11372]